MRLMDRARALLARWRGDHVQDALRQWEGERQRTDDALSEVARRLNRGAQSVVKAQEHADGD